MAIFIRWQTRARQPASSTPLLASHSPSSSCLLWSRDCSLQHLNFSRHLSKCYPTWTPFRWNLSIYNVQGLTSLNVTRFVWFTSPSWVPCTCSSQFSSPQSSSGCWSPTGPSWTVSTSSSSPWQPSVLVITFPETTPICPTIRSVDLEQKCHFSELV